MAKKVFPQGYPRIQDEGDRFYGFLNDKALEQHKYKINDSELKEIIAAAIQNANKKSSRAIL